MSAAAAAVQPESIQVIAPAARTIRVGLVGLGQIGQAVARLAPAATRLREVGLGFHVVGALVRDVHKPRRCVLPSRLTSNPAAFLRGHYDVVIEALDAAEPAYRIVSRLLGRGTPVVSANKALVASYGRDLTARAARRSTTFRYEASALAGVPFLGALAARPLVSDIERCTAIVNGSSNFVLSAIAAEGISCDEAVRRAQRLGLTEPDPSRDLDGLDAVDKLTLLASIFGWGTLPPSAIETQSLRDVSNEDAIAARELGGVFKPIAQAAIHSGRIEAFVGPAWVPTSHPLASVSGALCGIHLSGRFVRDLFFSGPGAGPGVTAATLLDDAVEAVTSGPRCPRPAACRDLVTGVGAAVTPWLVRVQFPGVVPDRAATSHLFERLGLVVSHVSEARSNTRWLVLAPAARGRVDDVLARLHGTHRLICARWRCLSA